MKGIVWDLPEDSREAAQGMREIRETGADAVRTGVIREEGLLTLADTLGLVLFQELPLEYLSAGELEDTLTFASARLREVLQRSARHPSARNFGLLRRGDTSDSLTCAMLADLARIVREEGPPGSRTYYLSLFVEEDRCADAVDFVLIDARDDRRPSQKIRSWRESHGDRVVGLGAVGTWARADSKPGLNREHSPEWQARFLEDALNDVLQEGASEPAAVFVSRWKDVKRSDARSHEDPTRPYERAYGLHDGQGGPRPAYAVVRGFFTGSQRVFAFPAGEVGRDAIPWYIFMAWGILGLLGLFYTLSPRFRSMLPRYFRAHVFYQDAVREGRQMLFGASLFLLLILSLCAGVIGGVILDVLSREPSTLLAYRWMPEAMRTLVLTLIPQPWIVVVFVACMYAVLIVLWTPFLALASGRRRALSAGQVLMLTVWPRWPLIAAMFGSVVVSTFPQHQALTAVLWLALIWVLIEIWATVRTLFDYYSVSNVSLAVPLVFAIVNPIVFLGVGAYLASQLLATRFSFFWTLLWA